MFLAFESLTLHPEEYEYDTLRQYLRLFPTLPLGSMIKGYLLYFGIPLEEEEEDDEDVEKAPASAGDEDPFDLVMVCSRCSCCGPTYKFSGRLRIAV